MYQCRSLLCIASVIFAQPARSDWQYTKWGMTSDQIIKSSKGSAYVNPDQRYASPAYEPSLIAPYQAGPHRFTANFSIKKTGGLSLVVLIAPISQCESIKDTLISKYGQPDPEERRQFGNMKWRDRKAKNIVVAAEIGSECQVVYRPLSLGGGEGL